jgi:hypothetical protein
MNSHARIRFGLAALLVAMAIVLRIAPHPWNFAPVGAISLFAGACFDRRRDAFLAPLVLMFLSDSLLEWFTGRGYHALMPVIYATYALITAVGMLLRDRRTSILAVGLCAITSSTLFFIISNFAVWLRSSMYPPTAHGLLACYIAAIPFFGNTLASDLIYSALLFGTFVWAERTFPKMAQVS